MACIIIICRKLAALVVLSAAKSTSSGNGTRTPRSSGWKGSDKMVDIGSVKKLEEWEAVALFLKSLEGQEVAWEALEDWVKSMGEKFEEKALFALNGKLKVFVQIEDMDTSTGEWDVSRYVAWDAVDFVLACDTSDADSPTLSAEDAAQIVKLLQ